MPKLTDTQLVILSTAANRKDQAVPPLPKSLKITVAAVTKTLESLLNKGLLKEKPAPREAAGWRNGKDGQRVTLAITKAGLGALEGGRAAESITQSTRVKTRSKKGRVRAKPTTVTPKTKDAASPPTARTGTKQAMLIDLLKRKTGATIDEAVVALGWQAHSVRGAISGALKKKLGLAVSSEMASGRGRVYRIAG